MVFLRKLPADSRVNEIRQFFMPILKGGVFRHSGKIMNVDILALSDTFIGNIEFHAVVTIDRADVALRAIRKLHAKRFKNRYIAVREYIKRDWHNDRRYSRNCLDNSNPEKRLRERRGNQKLQVINGLDNINIGHLYKLLFAEQITLGPSSSHQSSPEFCALSEIRNPSDISSGSIST